MSQRKIGRACAAGLLAAVLLLAGSAPAGAAGKGPASLWGWMMEGWQQSVLNLWRSVETPGSGEGSMIKAGPGIDPNGGTAPKPESPTGTACQDCGDLATGGGL
jgi:hypothetical protein